MLFHPSGRVDIAINPYLSYKYLIPAFPCVPTTLRGLFYNNVIINHLS
jgi:hypothetical protein